MKLKKFMILFLVIFLVTACFGETNDVVEDAEKIEEEAEQEVVEFLECVLEQDELYGEYVARFVDGEFIEVNADLIISMDDFDNPDEAAESIMEHFEAYNEENGVYVVTNYEDEVTLVVTLHYFTAEMDLDEDGYYVHFAEDGDYIHEEVTIDELREILIEGAAEGEFNCR